MKQYFIAPAYSSNYHVVRVNDGKVECDQIVAYHEMEGYTSALESFGYQRAEYVPAAEKALKKAQEAYEEAKKALEEAKKHPLNLSKEDAKKYHFLQEDYDTY